MIVVLGKPLWKGREALWSSDLAIQILMVEEQTSWCTLLKPEIYKGIDATLLEIGSPRF